MENQSHVRITGPLAIYAAGFEQELIREGYRWTKGQLWLMAQLSRWLSAKQLGVDDVTEKLLAEFLRKRNATRRGTNLLSMARLQPLLNHLRNLDVIPLAEVTPPVTPIEPFIEGYRNYLDQERGSAPRYNPQLSSCRSRFLDSYLNQWLP